MKATRRDFIKNAFVLGSSLLLPKTPLQALENTNQSPHPAYRQLENTGNLASKVEKAYAIFKACVLCPRQCGANRLKGEKGFCRATDKSVLYSAHPHFGEEQSLVGKKGSGTIFFSNCNLRCVFCQNWSISHLGHGNTVKDSELANIMIRLQKIGCHNINLVTPTHVMPNILSATRIPYE